MSTEKIDLSVAVSADGRDVKHLTIRRPKVRDMIAAEKSGAGNEEKEIRLFANLCEVTPDTIEALDLYDYRRLQEAYQDFLSSPPKQPGDTA